MPDQMIEIKNPFTLDLRKDGSAPSRKPNEMQILTNYQCKPGGMFTRKGITLLSFTAATTPLDFPEEGTYTDLVETAICKCVLKFEKTTQLGWNSVKSADAAFNPIFNHMGCPNYSGETTYSTDSKEGTYSLYIDNSTARNTPAAGQPGKFYGLRKATSVMPDWFPGVSTSCRAILVTVWVAPTLYGAAVNEEDVLRFGNETSAFSIRWFDTNLQAFFKNKVGGTSSEAINNVIVDSAWQFIAAWRDFQKDTSGLYHYHDVTKVETYTATTYANSNDWFVKNAQDNTVGGGAQWDAIGNGWRQDDSEGPHAKFDYLTIWTKIFRTNVTSNITLIRTIRDLHAS